MISFAIVRDAIPDALENRKQVIIDQKNDSIKAANQIAFMIRDRMRSASPTVLGGLKSSWKMDIRSLAGQVKATVYSTSPASFAFEYGVAPGRNFPPPEALRGWMAAKGIGSGMSERNQKRYEFAIRRNRFLKGFPAQQTWTNALASIQGQITRVFNNLQQRMSDRLGGD